MLIHAAWVVPVTSPPIRDGFVRVDETRISAVGVWRPEMAAESGTVELPGAVLTPGLINPHTHLELTGYHGQIPPGPLWLWIFGLVKLRQQPGQLEREQEYVAAGAKELLRAGVTMVGDISRRNIAWPVLSRSPLRAVSFVELLTIASDPPRTAAEVREELDRMAADPECRVTPGVSPHAPYTVSARDLRKAVHLANERNLPWTAHWAETVEEVAFLAGDVGRLPQFLRKLMEQRIESPHCKPLEYLLKCLPDSKFDRGGSLAHGNYLHESEYAALAERGLTVIYCPRAHHFFGHTPHPFAEMRRAGVRVAIGTDSRASNISLAPLEELQFVRREVAPDVPGEALLEMITIDAARALGVNDRRGSLEVGKDADIAAFQLGNAGASPIDELIEKSPPAQALWIGGKLALEQLFSFAEPPL